MKLNDQVAFEGNLPENRMGAKIKTSAKLFDILSTGIYTDPILAPIRELSCNAWDAHIANKNTNKPFVITVPNWLEQTFAVEDFGTGIPPELFSDIFYTYGNSTKTDSDEMIGALGLGSKSPFAYTKSSYVVRNRYNGREYIYFCFMNQNGEPDGSLTNEIATDEPNGVKVEFAVREQDITAFHERLGRFYKYWQGTMPIFNGITLEELNTKTDRVLEGEGWYLEKQENYCITEAVAMMGNVPYQINVSAVPNMPKSLAVFAKHAFIINFKMGELNFTASREGLKYDDRTCNALINRLDEVRADFANTFAKQINAATTQIEFINLFGQAFENTFIAIRNVTDPEDRIKLVLGKTSKDTIEFKGHEYIIGELISKLFTVTTKKHQSFGLTNYATRSSGSARLWAQHASMLHYTAIDDVPMHLIHPLIAAQTVEAVKRNFLGAGEHTTITWTDLRLLRSNKNPVQRIFANSELFTATTEHKISLRHSLTFVVNDVGNSGKIRFRLLERRGAYLVDFNDDVSSLAEVTAELAKFIVDGGFQGATVEYLSKLKDLRAPVQQKIASGSIKLRYYATTTYKYSDYVSTDHFNLTLKTDKACKFTKKPEKVFNLDVLKEQSEVLYVVKRRSPSAIYDDFTSQRNYSIIQNSQMFALAGYLDFLPSEFDLLLITESQYRFMLSKGVKLKSMIESMREKINELHKKDAFIDNIKDLLVIKNVPTLTNIFNSFPASSKLKTINVGKQSFLRDLLHKTWLTHEGAKKDSVLVDSLLKVYMASHFGIRVDDAVLKEGEELNKKLNNMYPMLKHIRMSSQAFDDFMDYADSIDKV